MFACCHFGSSIDAAGACGKNRYRSQIAASANYRSGRHIASAMRKRAGQAAVLKRPAAKMCCQPRTSSGVGANNGFVEDAQGLASGASTLGASSLSAAPACGQEAERTTTVPGYASASVNTALTAANIDAQALVSGGNALGSAVTEFSALNLEDDFRLRSRFCPCGF